MFIVYSIEKKHLGFRDRIRKVPFTSFISERCYVAIYVKPRLEGQRFNTVVSSAAHQHKVGSLF